MSARTGKGNGGSNAPTPPRLPYEKLSFASKDVAWSNRPVSYWCVEPTGDWGEDNRIGNRLAIEYLRVEGEGDGHPLLGLIVEDMGLSPNREAESGIVVGFMFIVGGLLQALCKRGTICPDAMQRWLDANDQVHEEMLEAARRERSERARKAANARWAKEKGGAS